jgi:hypothetical protein
MSNLKEGCLFHSGEKGDLKKWHFFYGRGLFFFQMAGLEKLNLCSTGRPNDHYQRKAQRITVNAESNFININTEPKSITINAPGMGGPSEARSGHWFSQSKKVAMVQTMFETIVRVNGNDWMGMFRLL